MEDTVKKVTELIKSNKTIMLIILAANRYFDDYPGGRYVSKIG